MRGVGGFIQGFEEDRKSLRKGLGKDQSSVNALKCLRHYGGLSLRYSPPPGSASRPRGDRDSNRKDIVVGLKVDGSGYR